MSIVHNEKDIERTIEAHENALKNVTKNSTSYLICKNQNSIYQVNIPGNDHYYFFTNVWRYTTT
jgi:hypothetical protein